MCVYNQDELEVDWEADDDPGSVVMRFTVVEELTKFWVNIDRMVKLKESWGNGESTFFLFHEKFDEWYI